MKCYAHLASSSRTSRGVTYSVLQFFVVKVAKVCQRKPAVPGVEEECDIKKRTGSGNDWEDQLEFPLVLALESLAAPHLDLSEILLLSLFARYVFVVHAVLGLLRLGLSHRLGHLVRVATAAAAAPLLAPPGAPAPLLQDLVVVDDGHDQDLGVALSPRCVPGTFVVRCVCGGGQEHVVICCAHQVPRGHYPLHTRLPSDTKGEHDPTPSMDIRGGMGWGEVGVEVSMPGRR